MTYSNLTKTNDLFDNTYLAKWTPTMSSGHLMR